MNPLKQSVSFKFRPQFRGLSLTEVMVVMAIVSILVVVIGLGVRSALDLSRRTQCSSKLRSNMVTALLYVSDNGNKLPYSYGAPTGGSGLYWFEALFAYSAGSDVREIGGHNERREVIAKSRMFECSADREVPIGYGWSYPRLPYRPPADWTPPLHLDIYYWNYPSRVMVMGCAEKIEGAVHGFIYSPFPGSGNGFPAMWEDDFSRVGNISRAHGGGANFAFLDGHVEWRTFQDIIPSPSNPESRYFWGLENE